MSKNHEKKRKKAEKICGGGVKFTKFVVFYDFIVVVAINC